MSSRDLVVAAAGASAPSDPNFKNVSLLLQGDGTNGAQNNTFLDSSTNNFTITRNGNTTQGTFSPYGNLWSNYFDGSGDYLSTASNAAFGMGTGDFTLECWVYLNSLSNYNPVFDFRPGTGGFAVGIFNSTGYPQLFFGGTVYNPSIAISAGVWTHLALVRNSGVSKFYVNGVGASTTYTDSNNYGTNLPCYIGTDVPAGGSSYFNGYISNARVVKGTALYTSNFTPSTAPLTAVSGTSLLTCQSNRFIDNSTNAFALTVNGNPSVQRFSPFNPTAAYSAATIGGSGYFDGVGDYLNTPATGQFAPTGDFTIGYWFYLNALPTYTGLVGNYTANTSTDWIAEVLANGSLYIYLNGASVRISAAAGTIKTGQWYYLCIARASGTVTAYLNGTSLGTYAQAGTFGSASKTIYIGTEQGLYPLSGYIADVKLLDGSAVTTVPTAPMTATSGTSLLLSFTNAGIPDAAMLNDLETVGNVQVSTSVKKYGTGSLYFDGTGDVLIASDNPVYAFGTGDFTLEAWIYPQTSANYAAVITQNYTSAETSWTFCLAANGVIRFQTYYTILATSSNNAITQNTWQHVAVTRSGSTVRVFVNGVIVGTGTSSNDFSLPAGARLGFSGVSGDAYYIGYVDDARITKGYARYTANFTPPAQALPTN